MSCTTKHLAAVLAILLIASAAAHAVTPALLIGPDLQPRQVMLQSFGGGKITFFDSERTLQIESTGKLLQLRFLEDAEKTENESGAAAKPVAPPPSTIAAAPGTKTINETANLTKAPPAPQPPQPPPPARLDLIDGQRLIARWTGASDDGQKLSFQHAALGKLSVNLDVVSRFMLDGTTVAGATPAYDRVLLSNGDAMEGFVAAIKAATIDIQLGNAKPIALPIDRVRGLVLANPLKAPQAPRNVIVLRDGSRLTSNTINIESDKLSMTAQLSGKEITLALAQVARVELASPQGRLVDLAELPMKVDDGGEVFGLSLPPRVEGDVIRLHAPLTVTFELPENARRFAAVAELDATGPGSEWADFIVSIRAGGTQIARQAISHTQRSAAINAELKGNALTFLLDPAGNGPVMDRLRLREAVIYIENKTESE
ncbi:MAG: hypothetical protein WD768_05570 [Phycisphaeraceae bacterium]